MFYRTTLDRYLLLEENKDAYEKAYDIVVKGARNHMFIYGGEKTGKSHLLSSIREDIYAWNMTIDQRRECFIVNAETFADTLIYFARNEERYEYASKKKKAVHIDPFLGTFCFDDLHKYPLNNNFALKQLERVLHNNKKIIVTSAVPIKEFPKQISDLFFETATLFPIKPESMKSILDTFATQYHLEPFFPICRDILVELAEDGLTVDDMKDIILEAKIYTTTYNCRLKPRNIHLFLRRYNLHRRVQQILIERNIL